MCEALEWLGWVSIQVEKGQVLYNVDKAATTLQGAEDTNSDTVTSIDYQQAKKGYQPSGWQRATKASTVFLLCVALATELHEAYGSPDTLQLLAVVTALSMLYKVMDHMWDPIEAAKWSMQLSVKLCLTFPS